MGNTYNSLKSRYKEFMVPSMDILVNGKNLGKDLGLNIKEVEVKLSLAEEDSASFSILDCYEIISHSIASAVKNNVKPGGKVEIKMGYGSDKSTVFTGYVAESGLTFSDETGYGYSVTSYDAVKLMKESSHRRTFSSDTYAEVFQAVLKSYSGLCSVAADTMDMELEDAIMQDGSDYDFILEELIGNGSTGWEFHLVQGKASFLDGSSEPENAVELKPKYGLLGFEWKHRCVKKTVKALGYLPGEGLVSAEAKTSCKQLDQAAIETEETYVLGNAISKSQVTDKANARKKALESEAVLGSLRTVGLPQLIPGKQVTLSDIDSTIDGDYLIKEAIHTFSEDGYFTKLTVGG